MHAPTGCPNFTTSAKFRRATSPCVLLVNSCVSNGVSNFVVDTKMSPVARFDKPGLARGGGLGYLRIRPYTLVHTSIHTCAYSIRVFVSSTACVYRQR